MGKHGSFRVLSDRASCPVLLLYTSQAGFCLSGCETVGSISLKVQQASG